MTKFLRKRAEKLFSAKSTQLLNSNGSEKHLSKSFFKISTYSYGTMGKTWFYLTQLNKEE